MVWMLSPCFITIMLDRQVILVAGMGDLGKYICEELDASDCFDVAVLSRMVGPLSNAANISIGCR